MKKIGPKIFLSNKMFVVLNIVGKKKKFGPNLYLVKKKLVKKNSGCNFKEIVSKRLRWKIFLSKKFFGPQNFESKKILWVKIYFGTKISESKNVRLRKMWNEVW